MKKTLLAAAALSLLAGCGYISGAHRIGPTYGEAVRNNVAVQAEAAKQDTGVTDGARMARPVDLYRSNRTPAPNATRVSEVGPAASAAAPAAAR